jgi:hypothetical protein
MLGNASVRKYLFKQHADVLRELEQITKEVCTGEQARA